MVLGFFPTNSFLQEIYSASSNFVRWVERFPSVASVICFNALKLFSPLIRAVIIASLILDWNTSGIFMLSIYAVPF